MQKNVLIACSLFVMMLANAAHAAVRIDINPASDRKDILTRSCENWAITNGESATATFGGVTLTIRKASEAGDGIAADMWRGGFDNNATFMSDGVFVRNGDAGGQLELTLHGLTPGKHTIATFHNWLWNDPAGSFSVSVNGERKLTGLHASVQQPSEPDVASTFLEVNAEAGKDVVLLFTPEGNSGLRNVIINGLAIDVVDSVKQARKPSPASGDEDAATIPARTEAGKAEPSAQASKSREGEAPAESPAQPASARQEPRPPMSDLTVALSWAAAKSAVSHQFYFGADRAAIESATATSPQFKGDLTDTKFTASNLSPFETYFWRVDEVGADKSITRGDVWSFRPRHIAFPGAEGYGRFALGGRGGRALEVTNLNDSGPGSLREAIMTDGPRTIVFRVGGTIHLRSKLVVTKPYCTIAGQTAPGEGIAVRGYTFGAFGTHDVIMRYLRTRIGDESGQTNDGMGLGSCDNSIVDHCSVAWSIDEAFSSRGAKNITLQRSIVAEALNMSIHGAYVGTGKGHSYAGSISGDIGSFHHNLLADCAGRNWSLAGGLTRGGKFAGELDIRNNVVYNWSHRTNDGGVKALNLVGNYYIPGPASKVFHLLMPDPGAPGDPQTYFMAGNIMEGYPQYDADNWANGGFKPTDKFDMENCKLEKPFCEPHITVASAKQAYDSVIADVGANWPKYDSIDARTVKDVANRTTTFKGSKTGMPGIIDSQADIGEYPDLKGGDAPADADHDGMPDAWETAHGLNPSDPADTAKDSAGDGYTNLERYLNGIVTKGAAQ